ncbi:choice-of-anchor A family protein, partial [Hyalangium sp.]|uniref:choice-of-anchor A family protein n=1 Tax=Hyalangium sp. TaxID=2028555 RepID=UPI002D6F9F2C
TAAFQAAIDTRKAWGDIVDGDIALLATDATTNETPQLVENAIRHVLNSVQKRTGMYISLGCAYQGVTEPMQVTLLEPFGTFRVQGVPGCTDSSHIFQMYPNLISRDMWDGLLTGNGCAARSVFTHFPEQNFSVAAVAMSTPEQTIPGQRTYSDVLVAPGEETPFVSTPYILVRGASPQAIGCGLSENPTGEECDLGDGMNGQPALPGQSAGDTCSYSCRLNWCGDGVVDSAYGEECDLGANNGRTSDAAGSIGACTASCRLPTLPPSSNPPATLCKNVTVVAEYTCGESASIDNGSYDADNDLAGCTQTPAGPYGIGNTSVTLKCTDQGGRWSSCTGVVTVVDQAPPMVTLNGPASQSLECVAGGTYTDPGTSASDLCEGTKPVTRTGSVNVGTPGTYSLSYVSTDSAGNASAPVTRTVTVADTLVPTVTLNGLANAALECGAAYTDSGATAADQCSGNLSGAIVKTGTVNAAVPGTYVLRYNVRDGANRAAPEVSRVVTVRDTTLPTLTLNGSASVTLACGAPYTDPGATANDTCSGNLTPNITVTSNLDRTRAGQYTTTFRVADPAGNVRTATRQLTVGPCATCINLRLGEYSLFLQGDYTLGTDVEGKVAAGGNITMNHFSVGHRLADNNLSNTLVAGGNLTLTNGGVWGDARYGGSFSADTTVVYPRGTRAQGTPIDFAARFAELRSQSAQLASRTANGTTRRENWGGVMMRGTNASLNVFDVSASAFSGAVLWSIDAPANSFVVVNIRGNPPTFNGFGISFSGGITSRSVLYNFVDATSINAHGFGFHGTILAPYAHVTFANGAFEGGIYAKSMSGNAEGHINPLVDRDICP